MNDVNVLNQKSVLLFSQYFFGYEDKIAKKMRELGNNVSVYDEMSVKKPIERALLKVSSKIFDKKTEKYYFDILEKEKSNEYDYVLFIDCEMPTSKVLEKYKATFSSAKFCLHMWDSLENLKGVKDKFGFFDHITSFDRSDADNYQLSFRPLFFSDEYRSKERNHEYDYDLSFIGTIHSDRYAIIRNIESSVDRFYCYPYLQSRFIYYFYKIIKPEFRKTKIDDFQFEKIDSKTISSIVERSKVVLDIQHPKQTGLTMRTLEMLGMKKKLITTNADIKNYDFYNKNNICIIDRQAVNIDKNFYSSDYVELPENIYEYYSINQWIIDVLGVS